MIHTTASCSFSNCKCNSACVKGLGCLKGPGPLAAVSAVCVEIPSCACASGAGGKLGDASGEI
jgi:hypothetical protein